MKKPYIIYSLSKGRTTQKFNKSKVSEILDEVEVFLNTCTTANIQNPDSLKLIIYENNQDTGSYLSKVLDIAKLNFGESVKSPIAYDYPSGEPDSRNRYVWTLPGNKLPEVLQFINSNGPMPKTDFGPIQAFFTYSFKLLDLNTNSGFPSQEPSSNFCIWFSRGKSISPDLFFPFEHPDKFFWNYLDQIAAILPFKLEEKYLRLANVNGKGEVKSFKKIIR
ncbi:hypothetical protein JN11_04814 [Mucilaginibacter frigoritolerans]|uniref:Uncharacterized protein n=1 Tax=Mucilaginibacter frigoritolerans TaxID=652788 RepID=A0A562TLU3_9SPHI|nr:hypothetical protein [Mucilaginibacter frigoritolerans]TWI94208.1 hypothetical protein JN11_04814 [Mucilaginibacter frigoritolerans]